MRGEGPARGIAVSNFDSLNRAGEGAGAVIRGA
jgi:hypothetical protein